MIGDTPITVRTQERDSWVSTDEYATAEANPLAESLGAVIAKLNANHAADLARLAGMLQGEAGDAAGPLALGECAAARGGRAGSCTRREDTDPAVFDRIPLHSRCTRTPSVHAVL